jgi:predicted alpha/beta superfamily hydrolase
MRAILSILCILAVINVWAQESTSEKSQDIIIGKSLTIHSEILGEKREILIGLPAGYQSSTESYPVLYLLDGDGHFHHTTGTIGFLADNNKIPPMIVVGIKNTDRTRDLTPPVVLDTAFQSRLPTAGGADNFLKFIKDELIPYVDSHFRSAPYKILVGHSLGGLLAVHSFINDPEMFQGYIAISPSLWYDNQSFYESAREFLKQRDSLSQTFYMTMGNEGGYMLGGAMKLAALFEEFNEDHPMNKLDWKFDSMPDETHGTVPAKSTYNGLEFIYKDFTPPVPETYEEFTALMKSIGPESLIEQIVEHYQMLSDKYGYPISSESTVNSLGYGFLSENMMEAAVRAFETNTQNYPGSANAFDSLGDGYKAAGKTAHAKESYRKAITLAEKTGDPVLEASRAKLTEMEK